MYQSHGSWGIHVETHTNCLPNFKYWKILFFAGAWQMKQSKSACGYSWWNNTYKPVNTYVNLSIPSFIWVHVHPKGFFRTISLHHESIVVTWASWVHLSSCLFWLQGPLFEGSKSWAGSSGCVLDSSVCFGRAQIFKNGPAQPWKSRAMLRGTTRGFPPLLLGLVLGLCLERSFVAWSSPKKTLAGSWSRSKGPFVPEATGHKEVRFQTVRQATLVGSDAPYYNDETKFKAIVDEEIESMSFREYANGDYVVLFFYPLDFTFVCPTEIIAFSDRFQEFKSRNTQVLGVSVDSEFSHLAWIQMSRDEGGLGGLEYPLISDFHRDLAKAYGILSALEEVKMWSYRATQIRCSIFFVITRCFC